MQPFDSPYCSSTESLSVYFGGSKMVQPFDSPYGSSTESLNLEAGFPNGNSTESLHLEAGFPNGSRTESLHPEAGSILLPKMAAEDNIDEENIEKAKKVKDTKRGEDTNFSVPFYKLFMTADTTDIILMSIAANASVVNGLSLPIMSILFGNITDAFGQNEGANIHTVVHEVSQVALQFIDLASVAAIASFFQVAFWSCTGERQAARIRNVYLKTILRQDITFFDCETSTGEVIERMSGDTILIQEAIGGKVGMFIQFTSAFFGGFIVAFTKGWKLTLVMLATIPFLVAAGSAMSMIIAKTSSRSQKAYAEAGNVVEQTIGSIRTVASFTGEKKAVTDYDKSLKIAYKAAAQQGLAAGFGMGTSLFIIYCTYALALSYGSQLIINEGYSGGNVLNVIFAVLSGSMSITQTSPCLNAFAAGQAAAYKMFETINRKPEIDIYDTKGLVFKDIHGDIELRDVYFRYPARPDVEIFSGFSLRIPRGTTAALVGESGSGKSTVISLIERFYDPQAGEVLIDSFNIKQFQLQWIRQKIGLVSQEPVLFACTIKENIAYGKDGATLEEIHIAAELANAAKFIRKMPQGFDTMVGEHGTQLSGGQKQRIAIARAILKDPRILLLDEATSALDIESEKVVQEALNRIMINRTTVIVAHRLTTVRNADMIAVVKRGTIVEKGPHSRLTRNPSGAYSQLIHLQEVHQSEDQHSNDPDQHEIHFYNSKYISRVEFRRSTLKSIINESSGIGGSHRSILFPSAFPGEESLQDVEDGQQNLAKDVPLLRLASLNKPEAPVLILGSIAAIVNGCSLPAFALLFSSIMGSFYEPPHNLRKDVGFWSLIIVALAATSFLVTPLQMYCFAVAGGRLVRRIRSLTFRKVVYQEIGWFDHSENSTGAIGARLSTDAATVRSVVGDALSLVIQNISTIIAGIVIAFTANWKLALLVLAMLPLLGLQGFVQIKFTAGFFADAKVMYEQASQVAKDALGSIRTVASFSAEEKVMSLYSEKCSTPLTSGIRQGIISGLSFGLSNLMLFSVYGITFWVGAQMAKAGETTFSKVFRVFFSFTMVALGISQSMGRAPDFGKVKASVSTVFQILDRNSKIDANDASGTTLENVKGDIEFRHVSFKYPTRPGVQIFQDLSFCVQTGKTVALVGESGSGKSTVISLLERFYDINSGRILLDGVDIRRLQLKWLRQQMGLVSQEPILFNETIRANIAYGRDGITSDKQIVEASKASNAHQFISRLPQGYDTYVGENGLKLSGGQKQRIAIARAIVKNPRILLLDEATSALDAESEHIVQEALDHVMVNRSTIVVAHRLSTIKDADLIAVVKNGVIAEQGKHNELLAIRYGAYASLVKLHRASD